MEQTQQQDQSQPEPASTSSERNDLIAAIKDIPVDKEGESTEAAPAAEAAPSEPAEEVEAKEPPATSRLAKILKEREQARSVKLEVERMRAEAESARKEAMALQEQAKSERAKWEALRKNPTEAFRSIGLDPDEFVDAVLKEGSPEWKAATKQEQALESLRSELAELKAFKVEQEKQREEMKRQELEQKREQVYSKFLAVASEEACPHARALYSDREILAWGDQIADQYYAKTGQVASYDEIAQYMEEVASQRVQKVIARPKAKSKARTLTAADTSERRAAPKQGHEMTEAELRRALISEAEAVKRNYNKEQ